MSCPKDKEKNSKKKNAKLGQVSRKTEKKLAIERKNQNKKIQQENEKCYVCKQDEKKTIRKDIAE